MSTWLLILIIAGVIFTGVTVAVSRTYTLEHQRSELRQELAVKGKATSNSTKQQSAGAVSSSDGDDPDDPSWLLSTLAQCSAVVVGVVGGLLASRMLQRNLDKRRHREQRDQLQSHEADLALELKENTDLVLMYDAAEWLETCAPVILDAPLEAVIPNLTSYFSCRRDANDFVDHIKTAIALANDATPALEKLVRDATVLPSTWRLLNGAAAMKVETPIHDVMFKAAWMRASAAKKRKKKPEAIYDANPHVERPSAVARAAETRRDQARREMTALRAELRVVEASLAADETPRGIRHELWLLAGLAVFIGVIIPTSVLAFHPASLWAPWRALLVVAMAFSFMCIAAFLSTAQRLEEAEDDPGGILIVLPGGLRWPRDPILFQQRVDSRRSPRSKR